MPAVQLTLGERTLINKLVRMERKTPTEALSRVNAQREKKGVQAITKSAVHRFCRGLTHKAGAKETRGRKAILSSKDIRTLDKTRRSLIQKANNDYPVTYEKVIEEAGIDFEEAS